MNYSNYVNINVNNLNNNISFIKNKYNYKYYIFDVSNNAFNHGMYIVNYLNDKIDYLYVSNFNDVLLIRKYNNDISVIYNGEINENNIFDLILNNVVLLIKNIDILKNIINLNIKDKFNIILNIDLNNYNGINSKSLINDILDIIPDNINILGIKSHIKENDYDEFKYVISPLKNLKLIIINDEKDKNKIKLSNSIKLDYSIYGINDVKKSLFKKENLPLKQIFTLNSRLINIQKIRKNKKELFVGVIPFGYLNGMIDKIDKVFINNKLCEVKEIYEDYTLIDIDKNINTNDIVEIISYNNPLENYYALNTLLYFNTLCSNLPILYNNYILEKTFVY